MKQYSYLTLWLLLMLVACGTPRTGPFIAPTDPYSAPAPPAPGELADTPTSPAETVADTFPTAPETEEVNGPHLPPTIAPTVYMPYLRRAETPAPALPLPNNSCHLAVEVRNYDGIDGCGLLLETDAGNLFLVGTPPRGDPLEAGTRISIGYELMQDYKGSICANADAVIRITCMRLLRVSSGVPRPVVCEAYDKPSQWLHDLAVGYAATYVTRFPWKDGRYVYLLESPFGQYLYDCRGYQICQPRKNCLSFIEDFSQGVVIYEGQ